jgi:hypothetical protein
MLTINGVSVEFEFPSVHELGRARASQLLSEQFCTTQAATLGVQPAQCLQQLAAALDREIALKDTGPRGW